MSLPNITPEMAEIRIQPEASADIADIYAFSVERFGLDVAQDYMAGLGLAFRRLVEYPESGSVFEGIKPAIRRLTYRRHRIFYDFDGTTVMIVRILHQSINEQAQLRGGG
jgi:toxin ParE1/3/4